MTVNVQVTDLIQWFQTASASEPITPSLIATGASPVQSSDRHTASLLVLLRANLIHTVMIFQGS